MEEAAIVKVRKLGSLGHLPSLGEFEFFSDSGVQPVATGQSSFTMQGGERCRVPREGLGVPPCLEDICIHSSCRRTVAPCAARRCVTGVMINLHEGVRRRELG